jgi:hypothetical protein
MTNWEVGPTLLELSISFSGHNVIEDSPIACIPIF